MYLEYFRFLVHRQLSQRPSVSLTSVTPHSFWWTRLESLRAKLERSADEFIKARKELEEILVSVASFSLSQISAVGINVSVPHLKSEE